MIPDILITMAVWRSRILKRLWRHKTRIRLRLSQLFVTDFIQCRKDKTKQGQAEVLALFTH